MAVLPESKLPVNKNIYKVLQLIIRGRHILRFGNLACHHADILDNYLSSYSIPFLMTNGFPNAIGDGYELVGAGNAEVDPERKRARFFGRSMYYNVGINEDHLKEAGKLLEEWIFDVEKTKA